MKELWLHVSVLVPAMAPISVSELFLTSLNSCLSFLSVLTFGSKFDFLTDSGYVSLTSSNSGIWQVPFLDSLLLLVQFVVVVPFTAKIFSAADI